MPIKWNENWIIGTTLGNQIVIGKLDAKSKYPVFADKSPDRTEQAVTAVKQHMENLYNLDDEAEVMKFKFEDGTSLVFYPAQDGSKDE